jgi:hypothetical protein
MGNLRDLAEARSDPTLSGVQGGSLRARRWRAVRSLTPSRRPDADDGHSGVPGRGTRPARSPRRI